MENTNQELVIINDASIELLKGAPQVLKTNRDRTENVKRIGNVILNNWKIAKAMEDGPEKMALLADIDNKSATYIEKAKINLKTSKEDRAAATQIMDEIKKYFTSCENEIDITKEGTPVNLIQKERNAYVTMMKKIQEERERQVKLETAKKTEAIDIVAEMSKIIVSATNQIITNAKTKLIDFVNNTTLETYDERLLKLTNHVVAPPSGQKLGELIGYPKLPIIINHHNIDEVLIIQTQTLRDYDFTNFSATYKEELLAFKNSKLDEFPSKKAELEEAKEREEAAERERLEEVERQKIAEAKRQEALKAAQDEQQKAAMVQQQERERLQEQENIRLQKEKQETEARVAEAQRVAREEEEAERLRNEQIKREKEQNQEIDIQASGDKTMQLFEETAELTTVTPDSKSTYRIEVTNPVGYLALAQFWFENEGKALDNAKIEKKSFGQIVTYAQTLAKKSNIKLENKFIVYHVEHSAK